MTIGNAPYFLSASLIRNLLHIFIKGYIFSWQGKSVEWREKKEGVVYCNKKPMVDKWLLSHESIKLLVHLKVNWARERWHWMRVTSYLTDSQSVFSYATCEWSGLCSILFQYKPQILSQCHPHTLDLGRSQVRSTSCI